MHQCIQYLPQIVLCSKFENSIPFGYIKTRLNATGEPFDRAHEDFHEKDNVHKHAELMQMHKKGIIKVPLCLMLRCANKKTLTDCQSNLYYAST